MFLDLEIFVKWQRKKRSPQARMAVIAVQSPFFLLILPVIFYAASLSLDARYGLLELLHSPLNLLFSLLLAPPGILIGVWSVWTLYKSGGGTPAPLVPTQALVVSGPYALSRNPMILGVALYYAGIGLFINSPSFLALVAAFILFALLYVKLVEEKELKRRFGSSYMDYKRATPFFIPKL